MEVQLYLMRMNMTWRISADLGGCFGFAPSDESVRRSIRRSRVHSSPDRQMDDFSPLSCLSPTGLLACVADTLNLLFLMVYAIRVPASTQGTDFTPTNWDSVVNCRLYALDLYVFVREFKRALIKAIRIKR